MKKLCLIISILLVGTVLFAAGNPKTGTVAALKDSDSATLDYSLNLNSVDTYEIGFASAAVRDFSDAQTHSGTYSLVIGADPFEAADNNNLFVYWQIVSPTAVNIDLSVSSLKYVESASGGGSSITHYIDTTVTLGSPAGDAKVPSTASKETDESASATFDNIFEFTTTTTTTYSDTTTTYPDHQAAGSLQVGLVTENFGGKAAGTYTGTLTLTISTK